MQYKKSILNAVSCIQNIFRAKFILCCVNMKSLVSNHLFLCKIVKILISLYANFKKLSKVNPALLCEDFQYTTYIHTK